MGNIKRRLESVENSLTPKQAVIAWMEEVHRIDSPEEYAAWLARPPAHARLLEQVQQRVLRDRKIKELSESERNTLRKVTKQTAFLLSLHSRVNEDFQSRSRAILAEAVLLAEQLRSWSDRESTQANLNLTLSDFAELPYPLSEIDAACVSFAQRNSVMTFAHLEDARAVLAGADDTSNRLLLYVSKNDAAEWVRMYFARQGKTFVETGPVQNSAYGFTDVTDAEFEQCVHTVVEALKALTASGAIVGMRQLLLPSVPIAFLRRAPLIEGEWADSRVIELAEFGALLREKGFQIEASDDPHPLAWPRISSPAEVAENEEVVMQEAVQRLSGFAGAARLIESRKFLSVADYSAWSNRKVTGELRIEDGFSVASFNAWLESNGAAELAPVEPNDIYSAVTDSSFVAYPDRDDLEHALEIREEAIARLRKPLEVENSLDRWGEIFVPFATEVLTTISVVEYIENEYFDGHPILWKSSRDELEGFQRDVRELLDTYRELETIPPSSAVSRKGWQKKHRIDLDALTRSIKPAEAARHLIDLAKVETFEIMGEKERAWNLLASKFKG